MLVVAGQVGDHKIAAVQVGGHRIVAVLVGGHKTAAVDNSAACCIELHLHNFHCRLDVSAAKIMTSLNIFKLNFILC